MTLSYLSIEYYHQYNEASRHIIQHLETECPNSGKDTLLLLGKFLEISKALSDAVIELEAVSAMLKLKLLLESSQKDSNVAQYCNLYLLYLASIVPMDNIPAVVVKDAECWISDKGLSVLIDDDDDMAVIA
jgi:hypothetical protein